MGARPLVLEEREVISRELARGRKPRFIAGVLGRHHSSVYDEVKKNGGPEGYRAVDAQARADRSRSRPKERKLVASGKLHDAVNDGFGKQWSPEQISRRMVQDHPEEKGVRISHETIYETLYLQARGELRTRLRTALRTGRTRRVDRSRASVVRGGMINISDRPAVVEDRAVPGFWEGDLIIGKGGRSQIATLVERTTRLVMLVRIPYDRCADRVAYLLGEKMRTLPEFMKGNLTWDQGKEMARHAEFTVATGLDVFFCDPHSPWQRGSNENTNGLLRQYFPKGTDLSVHSQADLDRVAETLNGRPRKTLDWSKPIEVFNDLMLSAVSG
jgi:transposase, IS30 family